MKDFKKNLTSMSPDLFRIAMKRTGNEQDALDLVQDALLRAWEKQNKFTDGNQTAWVVRIMINIFNDNYRKATTKVEVPGEDGAELEKTPFGNMTTMPKFPNVGDNYIPDVATPANEIETHIEIQDVNKALNAIGEKCKEILLLIAEEYKYKEISEKLAIPMGTTMNRLLRCRKQLHQDLYGSSKYNEI